MKLSLLSSTQEVETLIATALLTTTSGAKPSTLFRMLLRKPERVAKILGRLEIHHGSVLEHNRFVWILVATEEEVLDILLKKRFYDFTKLRSGKWLVSANLRTVVEYVDEYDDEFARLQARCMKEFNSSLSSKLWSDRP